MATGTLDKITAAAAGRPVVPRTRVEAVVAAAPVDRVVAAAAADPLVATAAAEDVIPVGAVDRLAGARWLEGALAKAEEVRQEAERRRRDALRELFDKHPQWGSADDERWSSWVGNLWIGTEGVMYTFGHGDTTVAMFPEEKYKDLELPPGTPWHKTVPARLESNRRSGLKSFISAVMTRRLDSPSEAASFSINSRCDDELETDVTVQLG